MENNQALEAEKNEQAPSANQTEETKSSSQPKLTSFFSLLETSINDWWKNLRKFVEIYLWGMYYSLIPMGVMLVAVFASTVIDLILVKVALATIAATAGGFIIFFFMQAYSGMFVFLKKNFQGSAKESFKAARPLVWAYLALSITVTIFVIFWSLLLIIPGIIFSIYYSLAVYAFFFEDKKGMAAIKRSKALVKGYWWPVAGRVLGFSLILWLFMMLISIPGIMAVENSWFWNVWNIVVQIISYLIGPMAMLFSYTIYRDLVNAKK